MTNKQNDIIFIEGKEKLLQKLFSSSNFGYLAVGYNEDTTDYTGGRGSDSHYCSIYSAASCFRSALVGGTQSTHRSIAQLSRRDVPKRRTDAAVHKRQVADGDDVGISLSSSQRPYAQRTHTSSQDRPEEPADRPRLARLVRTLIISILPQRQTLSRRPAAEDGVSYFSHDETLQRHRPLHT